MARPRRSDQVRDLEPILLCDEPIVHAEAVHSARAQLPRSDVLAAMSSLFAALGDPTRLRVVNALSSQELCVCDLAATLEMSQSSVSHQLRILRSLGLVKPRRDGRLVYYALDDAHVSELVALALDHVRHRGEETT